MNKPKALQETYIPTPVSKFPVAMAQLNQDVDVVNRTIYLHEIDIDTPAYIHQRAKMIYEISEDDTTPITLFISCFGGDAYGMFGTVDMMKNLPSKVNTLGVGTIQSAATTILAAGTGERSITKHSIVMIHQISTWLTGQTEDIEVEARHIKELQNMLYSILEESSNKPQAFWKRQSKINLYLPAEKCKEYGLVDKIV